MTVLVYFSSENRSDESKQDHSIAHLTATLNGVLNDSVFWTNRLSQRFNDPCTNICLILDESAVWRNRLNERLNDSLNKTAYHLHLQSLSTNQSNLFKTLFFKSVQTHFNFIQELCIYKTITFYDSSLVLKKISTLFFFQFFFSSHPVAYSRPPRESVRAPLGVRAPPVENHCFKASQE